MLKLLLRITRRILEGKGEDMVLGRYQGGWWSCYPLSLTQRKNLAKYIVIRNQRPNSHSLLVMTGVRVWYTLLNFHNAMSGYPTVPYKGGGFKSNPSTVNLNASFRE